MFKESSSYKVVKWDIIAIYHKDKNDFYLIKNRDDNSVLRVGTKDLHNLIREGKNGNFSFKGNKPPYALVGEGIKKLFTDKQELSKRFTPLSILENKGKPVEIILIDEDTGSKVKVTISQLRALYNSNLTNLLSLRGDTLIFPKEIPRYDKEKGIQLMREAEDNRKAKEKKKLKKGTVDTLIKEGYEKAEKEGVFNPDTEEEETEHKEYLDRIPTADSEQDIVNSILKGYSSSQFDY